MRRFTKLTDGFLNKIENHSAAVQLYVLYSNFGRKHMTLGTTLAAKGRLTDHNWNVQEIVAMREENEPTRARGAPQVQTEPLPLSEPRAFNQPGAAGCRKNPVDSR